MEREKNIQAMKLITRVIIIKDINMGKDYKNLLMVRYIEEIFVITCMKDLELMSGLTNDNILENGNKIKYMGGE